jgi:hypothetical protein
MVIEGLKNARCLWSSHYGEEFAAAAVRRLKKRPR